LGEFALLFLDSVSVGAGVEDSPF